MAELLFIHGFATGPRVWELQVEEFQKDNTIHTDPEEVSWMNDLYIVGWSMGVYEAVRLYFLHTNKIKGMVFVSGAPKFLRSDDYSFGLSPALLRSLEKKVKNDLKAGISYFYDLMFNGPPPHPIIKLLPIPSENKAMSDLEKLRTEDIRPLLPGIEIPVLLIHGGSDRICLPEASVYMKHLLPDSEIEIYPGIGHAPFLESPRAFNRSIRTFMEKNA